MGIDINVWVEGDVTDEEYQQGLAEFEFRIDGHTLTREGWTPGRVELDKEASWTRYWGPHYERGPWPEIAGWLEALRAAFPNHVIRYGGDNDEEYGEEVDDDMMRRYWAHWRSPAAHNYRDAFK